MIGLQRLQQARPNLLEGLFLVLVGIQALGGLKNLGLRQILLEEELVLVRNQRLKDNLKSMALVLHQDFKTSVIRRRI